MQSLMDQRSGPALKFNCSSVSPLMLLNNSVRVSFIRLIADFLSCLERELSLIVPASPVMTSTVNRNLPMVLFNIGKHFLVNVGFVNPEGENCVRDGKGTTIFYSFNGLFFTMPPRVSLMLCITMKALGSRRSIS